MCRKANKRFVLRPTASLCLLLLVTSNHNHEASGFSMSSNPAAAATTITKQQPLGNVLILDHLNINHEKGRHDLLKAFYFDFLQCAVDPRKEENLSKGKKTLWANIGSNQFHLPEGKPDAQVFDGVITLSYPSLDELKDRYYNDETIRNSLKGTKFDLIEEGDGQEEVIVMDPWGTKFRVVRADDVSSERDARGSQPGGKSAGLAMTDLTVHAPTHSNFEGIARFYDRILGAPVLDCTDRSCVLSVGPKQTLTFLAHPLGASDSVSHEDLIDEEAVEGKPHFPSNYGPHVSMYVSNIRSTYQRAADCGVTYVNPRFKRRAYTLEEAVDDCMFRCIDIVDPDDVEAGPILKLEHEVRSVVKRDGSKYKSCPFDEIPEGCLA